MPLMLLDGVWLLLLSVWPLFGLCSNSSAISYLCGHEGVQLKVAPNYLGADVAFLVRDEFGMAYDLDGCISKCVFSAKKPNGESVFYVSYPICISYLEDKTWNLRVRLVGSNKTKDILLVCLKPKFKKLRTYTSKPKGSAVPLLTTVSMWTASLGSTSTMRTNATLPTKASFTQDESQQKKTPGKDPGKKEPDLKGTSPIPIVGRQTTSRLPIYPEILNESQCIVPTDRIPCLDSRVPRETCLRSRCCHDPADPITPCYYGHTVTANCSLDGSFELVISRYAISPPLLLTSVILDLGTCPPPVITEDFLVIRGQLLACSTPRLVQGKLIYELSITTKQDVLVSPSGSITRDSSLTVTTQCLYNITLSLNLVSVVEPLPPFPSVTNSGILDVELRIAKGKAFSDYYTSTDYPLQIPLRELLFFEARLLQPSDPRLHLRLHHCWGTPSLDPASTLRWPLIYNGCPFTDDDPMTDLLPGPIPSGYQRFVVSAFTFLGLSSQAQVFVFCSVSVCVPSSNETCSSDCSSLKRGRRFEPDYSQHLVKTAGPLVFQSEVKTGLASLQQMTLALPGILFAVALLILLCLVVVLKLSFMVKSRGHLNVH